MELYSTFTWQPGWKGNEGEGIHVYVKGEPTHSHENCHSIVNQTSPIQNKKVFLKSSKFQRAEATHLGTSLREQQDF